MFASLVIALITGLCFITQVSAVDYYLDSQSGADRNSGTSPTLAWATLQRANTQTFSPGDQLLIKAGTVYQGQLKITSSGILTQPITITRFGEGDKPRLDGQGVIPATVWVHNAQYITVSHLQITNTGKDVQPNRSGVRVSVKDFGTAHNITISHLDISHVNGSVKRFDGLQAAISYYNQTGSKPSCFNGLTIEHCTIKHVDRDGIKGRSDYWKRTVWHPNLNVVIRHNQINDVAGDGIVPYGCDGAIVEYNQVTKARQRTSESAVGIWPWSCDNTLIQYNEVSHTRGLKDGQGFDSDYNCRNTTIQYNYSHHNDGGFVLVCNSKMSPLINVGNVGTIIRYNVSYNDGSPEMDNNRGPIFVFSGASAMTRIYNNLIYLDKPTLRLMINVYANKAIGTADNVLFANNVFYVADGAQVTYNTERMTHGDFVNNVFYGQHGNKPENKFAIDSDHIPALFKEQTPTFDWLRDKSLTIPSDWQGCGISGLGQPATELRGNSIQTHGPINVGPWQ